MTTPLTDVERITYWWERAKAAEERADREKARADAAEAEAERLRNGLRRLERDYWEAWDDAHRVDARDFARSARDLLGPDFDASPTWVDPGDLAALLPDDTKEAQ